MLRFNGVKWLPVRCKSNIYKHFRYYAKLYFATNSQAPSNQKIYLVIYYLVLELLVQILTTNPDLNTPTSADHISSHDHAIISSIITTHYQVGVLPINHQSKALLLSLSCSRVLCPP